MTMISTLNIKAYAEVTAGCPAKRWGCNGRCSLNFWRIFVNERDFLMKERVKRFYCHMGMESGCGAILQRQRLTFAFFVISRRTPLRGQKSSWKGFSVYDFESQDTVRTSAEAVVRLTSYSIGRKRKTLKLNEQNFSNLNSGRRAFHAIC